MVLILDLWNKADSTELPRSRCLSSSTRISSDLLVSLSLSLDSSIIKSLYFTILLQFSFEDLKFKFFSNSFPANPFSLISLANCWRLETTRSQLNPLDLATWRAWKLQMLFGEKFSLKSFQPLQVRSIRMRLSVFLGVRFWLFSGKKRSDRMAPWRFPLGTSQIRTTSAALSLEQ